MSFIPADHATTVEDVGLLGTLKIIAKAGYGYRHTMAFYLKTQQFRSLSNFLFTKTFVPTGEGSGEAAYYAIGPLLQKFPQLAPYPKYIEIEITSRCNKRCIICEHTWWKEKSTDLSFEAFEHLTSQFDLRWANLTGIGDAFLNSAYLSMIALLKRRRTSVFLVDSFDLIDSVIANNLVSLGVDGIYISMDGATKETYESIKAGCNYDKVLNNIKNLLDAKKRLRSPIPEICFRFVINKKNVHEIADFVETVRKLGPRDDWGDGSMIHYVGLLDFPETRQLCVDKIPQDLINKTVQAGREDGNLPVVFAHTELDTNPSINRCLAWMEPYFALVPHHMVLPCCAVLMNNNRERLSKYCFGNYSTESMKSIWDSRYYQWFRSTVTKRDSPVPALCVGCRVYNTKEREKVFGIDLRERKDFE